MRFTILNVSISGSTRSLISVTILELAALRIVLRMKITHVIERKQMS